MIEIEGLLEPGAYRPSLAIFTPCPVQSRA